MAHCICWRAPFNECTSYSIIFYSHGIVIIIIQVEIFDMVEMNLVIKENQHTHIFKWGNQTEAIHWIKYNFLNGALRNGFKSI